MADEEVNSKLEDYTPNSRPKILLEDQLAKGDHLSYVSLPLEVESVWEMQTTSQWLAEAHQQNSEKTGEIPEYL